MQAAPSARILRSRTETGQPRHGRFPGGGAARRTVAAGILAAALGAVPPPAAFAEAVGAPPVQVPDEIWQPLRETVDPRLEAALTAQVQARPAWRSLAARKKLAIGLVDLADPARPRFAEINGNVMMYAASLPKIAILLAAYESFEDGSLAEAPEVHADMAAMIRTSSNRAATAMIDRIGFEKIAQVMADPRYRLYDRKRGGGLWVGKRYAKQGRRVGDPLAGISHAATATQVCRFYYLLATGRMIDAERSRQMLEHLSDPGLHHKFVGVLEQRAPRARLFRKSGSWQRWHSDSILVWGPVWRRYILVAMVESPDGDALLKELVPVAERLLRPQGAPAAPQ